MALHPFYRGKVETALKCTVRSFNDFAIWYIPGVGSAFAAAAGIGSVTAYFLTLRHIRAAKDERGVTYVYPTPALHKHEEE